MELQEINSEIFNVKTHKNKFSSYHFKPTLSIGDRKRLFQTYFEVGVDFVLLPSF